MYFSFAMFFAWLAGHVAGSAMRCLRATDCSLNGDCIDGICHCDPPWTGPRCETMRFKSAPAIQGYGMLPNMTTWGGGVLFDGKKYHLYICVITNRCPLSTWRQNSRIDHAVADSATGPYVFRDVAVSTWSHNPAPVRLADGTYAIFHIGEGSGTPDGGNNCYSGSILDGSQDARKVFTIAYSEDWVDKAHAQFVQFMHANGISMSDWELTALDREGRAVQGPETISREQFPVSIVATKKMQAGSSIHVSDSLDGPWRPLVRNTLGICNNPAPWVHSNGTIFIYCSGILQRSEQISGPWTLVTSVSLAGGPQGNYEDPFLYVDKRGLHIIYHVYSTADRTRCAAATVSAHAFSDDGYQWSVSPRQPFSSQVEIEGIGTVAVSTRERPSLVFDKFGRMTHLVSAVCHAAQCPHEAPCTNCKYTHWDYTIVHALDLSTAFAAPPSADCVGACSASSLSLLASYRGTLAL